MTTTSIAHEPLARIVAEAYTADAWHGPNLRTALVGVAEETAFRRPAPGRHSIAEIALHHAYCARSVRGQLTGRTLEPFVLEGEDWFAVDDGGTLTWSRIAETVETEQRRLAEAVAAIEAGRLESPLAADERIGLALGITCHAVYHAGQIQLVKRLLA